MADPLGHFLRPPGYVGPRGIRPLVGEALVLREAAHLLRPAVKGRSPGCGDDPNQPVLLIPGFLAGDATLKPMAGMLRRCGYRTYRSRIRANVRCAQAAGEALERRVESIAERRKHPVAIVGHSLGGLMAKALANRRPDLVAGIVTLGSPLLAPGAVHRALAFDLALLNRLSRVGFGGVMGADCTSGDCARRSWEELSAAAPPGLPFTSVYSRRDGIIDWRACLDPDAEHVEVRTSHVGMAVGSDVYAAVVAGLRRIN
ncbi:MAG: alpha/beta hydrolase [Propionibacteriales bacterium]|nr:alpha/beta hydrolase [Propionibacteriales bacterium]